MLCLDNSVKFGEYVRELREVFSFSMQDIADRLYISKAAVSKFESGELMLGINKLLYLSVLFEVSISDFLDGKHDLLDSFKEINELKLGFKDNILNLSQLNDEDKPKFIKAYVDLEAFILKEMPLDVEYKEHVSTRFNTASNYFSFIIKSKPNELEFNQNPSYETIKNFKDEIESIEMIYSLDDKIISLCGSDYRIFGYYISKISKERANKIFTDYYDNGGRDTNIYRKLIKYNAKYQRNGIIDEAKSYDILREVILEKEDDILC